MKLAAKADVRPRVAVPTTRFSGIDTRPSGWAGSAVALGAISSRIGSVPLSPIALRRLSVRLPRLYAFSYASYIISVQSLILYPSLMIDIPSDVRYIIAQRARFGKTTAVTLV